LFSSNFYATKWLCRKNFPISITLTADNYSNSIVTANQHIADFRVYENSLGMAQGKCVILGINEQF